MGKSLPSQWPPPNKLKRTKTRLTIPDVKLTLTNMRVSFKRVVPHAHPPPLDERPLVTARRLYNLLGLAPGTITIIIFTSLTTHQLITYSTLALITSTTTINTKFLSLLTLASFAAASPFRRQQTVTGTIKSSVDTVSSSSLVTLNEIDNNVALIKNNVDAQLIVQAQALVKANYQAIAQGLAASTTTIVSVTTGAAGGVAGQAIGLTNQQIATLTASILIVIDIIENIGATVTVTVTDLTPALRATFQAEINAVKAAVNPFVSPVLLFAAAVRAANVGGSATITGLDNAIVNLLRVQSEVAASIGIPPLSL
ncbi:uncharacterized protein Y057_13607 [Fusarium fujikuroi]|nr:uncharacterized protein Y057_13607 [Fusarium fujikuroi]